MIGHLPVSVSVAERGRLVYAHEGFVLRPPASDEKLLLSMALLDRFGARYRIPTTVEGLPQSDGSVWGNVWLVGHGDPEINDAALARLARKLRASGLRSVRGAVIGVTNTRCNDPRMLAVSVPWRSPSGRGALPLARQCAPEPGAGGVQRRGSPAAPCIPSHRSGLPSRATSPHARPQPGCAMHNHTRPADAPFA